MLNLLFLLYSHSFLIIFCVIVLAMILNAAGIPKMRWYGVEGDYNVMVIDMLGPSLENLFNYCGRKFSSKTVLILADHRLCKFIFRK